MDGTLAVGAPESDDVAPSAGEVVLFDLDCGTLTAGPQCTPSIGTVIAVHH